MVKHPESSKDPAKVGSHYPAGLEKRTISTMLEKATAMIGGGGGAWWTEAGHCQNHSQVGWRRRRNTPTPLAALVWSPANASHWLNLRGNKNTGAQTRQFIEVRAHSRAKRTERGKWRSGGAISPMEPCLMSEDPVGWATEDGLRDRILSPRQPSIHTLRQLWGSLAMGTLTKRGPLFGGNLLTQWDSLYWGSLNIR